MCCCGACWFTVLPLIVLGLCLCAVVGCRRLVWVVGCSDFVRLCGFNLRGLACGLFNCVGSFG